MLFLNNNYFLVHSFFEVINIPLMGPCGSKKSHTLAPTMEELVADIPSPALSIAERVGYFNSIKVCNYMR